MNPEERALLVKTAEMATENNKMLHKMRRAAHWSVGFKVVYWVLIIVLSFGAYVAIQPYINQLQGIVGSIQKDVGAVSNVANQLRKF